MLPCSHEALMLTVSAALVVLGRMLFLNFLRDGCEVSVDNHLVEVDTRKFLTASLRRRILILFV